MKKIMIYFLATALVCGLVVSLGYAQGEPIADLSCIPPPAGLISWWSGDETIDDRMNNNPGTAMNGLAFGTGVVNGAFSFDGVDDFVNIPDSETLDAIKTEITVESWIRPQQTYQNMWIFARRDPNISEGFSIMVSGNGELVVIVRTVDGPVFGTVYSSAPIIQFGEWQHVAVTTNTILGEVNAYVNGNPISIVPLYGPHPVSGDLANVNNLFIGRREGDYGYFAGDIDEMTLYSRALLQAEIQAFYNVGGIGKCAFQATIDIKPDDFPNSIVLGSRGTVPVAILSTPDVFDATDIVPTSVRLVGAGGALKGNGTAMASVKDVNGDGWGDLVVQVNTNNLQLTASDTSAVLTGTSYNGPTFWGTDWVRIVKSLPSASCTPPPPILTGWWPGDGNTDDIIYGRSAVPHGDATTGPGLVGGAFLLDGDGDYVDVPHDHALNFGTGDFTVALWVFFNNTDGEQVLVEKWIQRWPENGEGESEGWTLTKLEGGIILLAMSDENGEIGTSSDILSIPARTWNHFAATRQSGRITLFMNGWPFVQGESPKNLNSSSSLKFGHRGNADDTPGSQSHQENYLNGRIDEVQLLVGRALPPAQIRAIFEAGRSGMCKTLPH